MMIVQMLVVVMMIVTDGGGCYYGSDRWFCWVLMGLFLLETLRIYPIERK